MREIVQAEFERKLKAMNTVDKFWADYRAERDRKWKAKPWYERAWIRSTAWIEQRRVRLGEIIAGRTFDDE